MDQLAQGERVFFCGMVVYCMDWSTWNAEHEGCRIEQWKKIEGSPVWHCLDHNQVYIGE